MGYISSFVGGLAEGTADVKQLELKEMAIRERDEANFTREKSLEEYRVSERRAEAEKTREFEGSQNKDKRDFEAEQNKENRLSNERVAGIRSKSDSSDKSMLKLDQWYRERMDDIDDMQAKSEITPEAAAQMRRDVDQRYLRESEGGGKGLVGKIAKPDEDKKSGGKTVAEYTDWLKKKYPGISQDDIDRRIEANADRLSDAANRKKMPAAGTETPKAEEKKQPYSATGPGERKARRSSNSDDRAAARAIAMDEYKNNVPAMDKADLEKWFGDNMQYLTLKQRELIRQRLGKNDKGRN